MVTAGFLVSCTKNTVFLYSVFLHSVFLYSLFLYSLFLHSVFLHSVFLHLLASLTQVDCILGNDGQHGHRGRLPHQTKKVNGLTVTSTPRTSGIVKRKFALLDLNSVWPDIFSSRVTSGKHGDRGGLPLQSRAALPHSLSRWGGEEWGGRGGGERLYQEKCP